MDDINNEAFDDAPRPLGTVIPYAFSGARSNLSPFLFLIFMVPLEVGNCGYRCGSMPATVQLVLDALGYADDLILEAEDTIQLQSR